MVKVSVFYPNTQQCRFDFDYYCGKHIPFVRDRLGDACTGIAVERAVAGVAPGARPPYVALAHFYFDSVAAFEAAFGPHAEEILADIPNYTNVDPVIQIGEVLINAARGQTGDLHLHEA